MDNLDVASTVEMDHSGYEDLQDQILDKNLKTETDGDIRDSQEEISNKKIKTPSNKKFVFTRGEESLEIDDDYELEMMADKRPIKLTLRELKDRAAGDIAVKNRMHSLAEEKKRVQATFKEFASISKKDPLGALEFISERAKDADSDFEYDNYIEKLGEQAEKLGNMDEKERKNFELEKKLNKAEQDLSLKQREAAIVNRKQELLDDYPGIGDSQFSEMVEAVLNNEDLLEGLEDENDVMDKVEELIQETLTQRDIMSVIEEIDPSYLDDNDLIFGLSDQIRQNPDLDEEDVRDILGELIRPTERIRSRSSERERDFKTLSQKVRQGTPIDQLRSKNADPYENLKDQLMQRKQELIKTPLYKR